MGSSFPRLLGDVGATNARFAMQYGPGDEPADVAVLPATDHVSLEAAVRAYLAGLPGGAVAPCWAAIGIATPVSGDRVVMTNHPWSFSIATLKEALGLARLLVINDFTALALAVPLLPAAELRQVGGGGARAGAIALIGPGTGLGVGGLAAQRGMHVPVVGEGGHVTLAATNSHEAAVIDRLQQRFGHASAERALSGQGLVNRFEACCDLHGRPSENLSAAEVTARALAATDRECEAALALFFALLGTTAGNLALTLGAQGGVYIGGGIVPRMLAAFEASDFRRRFEAKGRFADYLAEIPTFVICSEFPPALRGATRAFDLFD